MIITPKKKRKPVTLEISQPENADQTLQRLTGMILVAAKETSDERIKRLADAAMKIVLEDPESMKSLLMQLAVPQQQTRSPNPVVQRMLEKKSAGNATNQIDEVLNELVKRMNNERRNENADATVGASAGTEQ